MNSHLKVLLEAVAQRQRRLRLWWSLAACWAGAALAGLGLVALQRSSGWTSSLGFPVLAVLSVAAVVVVLIRQGRVQPDWRALARRIEGRYPGLDGRLLTAIQQEPQAGRELSFMQERLVREVLAQNQRGNWAELVPSSRIRWAQAAHWLALMVLAGTLSGLRSTGGRHLLARNPDFDFQVTVSPGDAQIERGESLVVLARFGRVLPANVDLVIGQAPGALRRIPLLKSLSDPLFGCTVPDLSSNLLYHVEYGVRRTRDFTVTVFDYPRLERADADVTFPDYTGQPPKHIENTRRLSAVEGSTLDLAVRFNKPVASARLIAKGKERSVLALVLGTNAAMAVLQHFPLTASRNYELQLVDADGRTNKTPAQFVIDVLKNRPPELRLAAPRGDLRPSPLEEIAFDGTVWDDFGVRAYGLGYTIAGKDPRLVELGGAVPAQQKRPFHYLLRLEDLGAQPDQLISWFLWAEDIGPDGQPRRTTGDLFFAEVRPFDEVFREGSGAEGDAQGESQGGEQSGSQGERTGRLADLEKQIMIATWKLQPSKTDSRPAAEIRNPKSERPKEIRNPKSEMPTSTTNPKPEVLRISDFFRISDFPALSPRYDLPAQVPPPPGRPPRSSSSQDPPSTRKLPAAGDDLGVVLEAQAEALEQAEAEAPRQLDPRAAALWKTAVEQMERALARLRSATNSPASLPEALAAEQSAYQALLRVQEHEYQVSRRSNRGRRGNASSGSMQRQLDQMDLTESDNRYEQQRQAQAPVGGQRREQLQVLNRLQELARRQQDLNDRLKELQSALQEARNEEERTEIRRRLKRLQEEEQQMVADMDELRQRMEQPENQSSMAAERQRLEQTRQDVQKAAEAAGQGQASQAVAAGTRAQEQLRQLRDNLRKENSSQFAEDLREMRAQARELAGQQEDLRQRMQQEAAGARKSLSDSPERRQMLEQMSRQRDRLTNLVERASQVSEQAEAPEPLLSKQLYDTVRRFSQDSAKDVKDLQEELFSRRAMTRSLLDRLSSQEPDGAKLLDALSELLRQDLLPEAGEVAQRAAPRLEDLKRGVENAAESVLGDDTEALRLAQQELNRLTDQLQQEIRNTQAEAGAGRGDPSSSTNTAASAQSASAAEQPGRANQPSSADPAGRPNAGSAGGSRGGAGANGPGDLNRLLDQRGWRRDGPLAGDDFVSWSDRLRDVEEMIDEPALRNQVAAARERARVLRQGIKRDHKKPDWDVIRLQIVNPLAEVRDRIADELARRQSREALVPIDRDPVPSRYSELVRRYYEKLGKDK
ncbi:MAG: hypothetical protein ACLQVX_15735 [Limisphaerales bacterium]